jgi:RHS repeat-associated protein
VNWQERVNSNYHFRHRDLSPTLGRWISQDPIGFEAGDANLYRYVGNGPTTRSDALGLWWWDDDWIELGVGGLLGFQGEEVQAEAGFNIVNNPLFGMPGVISNVDPTPVSGSVDAVLVGVWEGKGHGEIAVEIGREFLPGPRPSKKVGGPKVGIGGGGNPPLGGGLGGFPVPGRFSGRYPDGQKAYRTNVPRDDKNNPLPDPSATGPHTRLQPDRLDPKRIFSGTEFGSQGTPVRRVDFSGRPGDPLPHQHPYDPLTKAFGPKEPLS